jgi:hypothetical protein
MKKLYREEHHEFSIQFRQKSKLLELTIKT